MTLGFAAAFVGGLVTILAPCGALLLPAFFAYAFNSRATLASRTTLFFIGVLIALVPMGAAIGALSSIFTTQRGLISKIAGALVIVLGIIEVLNLPLPGAGILQRVKSRAENAGSRGGDTSSAIAVVLLGLGYGIAGAGCSGPILGSVLMVAGSTGSPLLGGLTMAIYALGMVIPVIVLALLWEAAGIQQKMRPRPIKLLGRKTTVGLVISGIILIILGAWLFLTGGSRSIGILSTSAQSDLETQIMNGLAAVPNIAFVALLVAGIAAIVLVWILLRRRR
ncbi:MAG: cytochrome c biogenesis CcdA family protein [Varibaculum sp.]|nr:cytochrome c biogenesis CcdA family protein [Varibaculum sp.]